MPMWWRRLMAWWTLANVNQAAGVAFGLCGAVAALAAAHFFFFAPHFPRPTVVPGVVIDANQVRQAYEGRVPPLVQRVVTAFGRDRLLAAPGGYDAGSQLLRDCDLYRQDLAEVAGSRACDQLDLTGTDYPEFLHQLVITNGSFDDAQRLAYLQALARTRQLPSGLTPQGAAPALAVAPPPEQRVLSGDSLVFAATTLRGAAVPVDVVTFVNNGHADAIDVQVSVPSGLRAFDGDDGRFDLSRESSKTLIYRRAATSSESGSASMTADPLPVEGFEVSSSTGDDRVTQRWAIGVLIAFLVIFVATVVRDVARTDPR